MTKKTHPCHTFYFVAEPECHHLPVLLQTIRYSPSQVPRLWHGLCDQWRVGSASPLQTHPWETIQMFDVWLCQCGGMLVNSCSAECFLVYFKACSVSVRNSVLRYFLFGRLFKRLWAKKKKSYKWALLLEANGGVSSVNEKTVWAHLRTEILGDLCFLSGDNSCHSFLNYLACRMVAGVVACSVLKEAAISCCSGLYFQTRPTLPF